MTDGPLLLAAILANPADDTVRLAYADWLDENDEAARAEFIRGQIHCYRVHGPGLYGKGLLNDRERELLYSEPFSPHITVPGLTLSVADGRFSWVTPEGTGIACEAERGFVESVTCTAADWLSHSDAIRREHPVTRVVLKTWPTLREMPNRGLLRYQPGMFDHVVTFDHAWWLQALVSVWPGVTFELPEMVRTQVYPNPDDWTRPVAATET